VTAYSVYKNSEMDYSPVNLTAGGLKVNRSSKWHEGVYVFDPILASSISFKISQASSINKETLATSDSMATSGEFQGMASVKAIQVPENASGESLKIDQELVGSYKLDTSISFARSTTSFGPHINLTKEVAKVTGDEYLFFINVTNDGNVPLGPIEVTDQLPYGLEFAKSSMRPEAEGQNISWSIDSLATGRSESIKLWTKRNCTEDDFTNTARVMASYNNVIVSDEALIRFSPSWLPCCSSRPVYTRNFSVNFSSQSESYCHKFSSGEWTPSPCLGLELSTSECLPEEGCNCPEAECSSCLIDEHYNYIPNGTDVDVLGGP